MKTLKELGRRAAIALISSRLFQLVVSPFVWLSAQILFGVRRAGVERMPILRGVLNAVGVFPILDHYYEPMFNPAHLLQSLRKERDLPGLDLNDSGQLELIEKFCFQDELLSFPTSRRTENEFFYENRPYPPGDSEFLYSMVRLLKPKRIVEIGSGYSTLMVLNALRRNHNEDEAYQCDHVCIEPYEAGWLEAAGARVVRQRVELADRGLFDALGAGDILFIDSSHMIRPQGDVIVEFLEIMPRLKSGVYVHIHDIFTPRDYLDEWVKEYVHFWNEQYLLEAFLSFNRDFRVVGAVNYLLHKYPDKLLPKLPILSRNKSGGPSSFWIQRV
jgi:predicted O-methyltransferase YrrM